MFTHSAAQAGIRLRQGLRRAQAADFTVGQPPPNYSVKFQEALPREDRYGGSIVANYDATSWLKFYDWFIIQRSEDYSVTQNQGYSAGDGITVPANNPYNPFGVYAWRAGATWSGIAAAGVFQGGKADHWRKSHLTQVRRIKQRNS